MARSFDYRASTIDEIATHLNTVQNQAFSKLIAYYTEKGDSEMLAKLQQARHLSKIVKLQQEYNAKYGAEDRA
jgi:phage terminase large subunit